MKAEDKQCNFGCGEMVKAKQEKSDGRTYTTYKCPNGHMMVEADTPHIPFPFPYWGIPYGINPD